MAHEHKHEYHETNGHGCSCCGPSARKALREAEVKAWLSRRELLMGAGVAAVGTMAMTGRAARAAEAQPAASPTIAPATELVVQPVLTYAIPQRRQQTSWRSWGGIQTAAQAAEEVARIDRELRELVASTGLAVRVLPVAKVLSKQDAAKVSETKCDLMLIYAAGGGRDTLDTLASGKHWSIFFLRHRSGPVSLYYEILHPHFLRKATDTYCQPKLGVWDAVVDDYQELAWRLRALAALRRTLGQRIIAIGGAGGWGAGHQLAPPIAKERWQLDIRDVSYPDLGKRIQSLRKDRAAVEKARQEADAYLRQPQVKLETDRKYVENAFVLYRAFKDLMTEAEARAMTIQHCMGTVMPISETTACLPLSLLNDEGYLAFCESDFVVIPSGILMANITGTPPFLNDPTYPYAGKVTIAHCTAPRRMDGKNLEPVTLYTHFESDYGAAPKVDWRVGQVLTNVVPDFGSVKWVGFKGTVLDNPLLDICRSQQDISIDGNWQRLLEDMRGFHWMTVYGDCRKEIGYAIKRLNIEWEDISA